MCGAPASQDAEPCSVDVDNKALVVRWLAQGAGGSVIMYQLMLMSMILSCDFLLRVEI